MKRLNFKHIIMGLAASSCLAFSSCTDLSETLYDELTEDNLDFNSENDVNSLKGQAIAQFRYIYWAWNGYFDLNEECSDTYMTPKRISIGWGDLYVNMHKHDWSYTLGHIDGLWSYAYKCLGYYFICLCISFFIPRVIIGLEVGIVIQIQFSQYHTSGITIRIPEYMLCSQIIFYCG